MRGTEVALRRPTRVTAAACMMGVCLMAAAAQPASERGNPNPSVQFSQGRLTIRAVKVPLKILAEEIKKKSGIVVEVRESKAAEKPITLELVDVAPAVAFEEILRGLNFATYYSKTRLSQVVVLSLESPPPQAAQSKARQAPPQPTPPLKSEQDLNELLTRNREEGLKAIEQSLKGNNRRQKIEALEALESFGPKDDVEVIRMLGEALSDSDVAVKKAALEGLVEKEGPAVMPFLRAALQDSNPAIRVEALEALADKGDLTLVRTALSDPSNDVREKAKVLLESERKPNESKGSREANPGRPGIPRR
jgi:hypothetical protein